MQLKALRCVVTLTKMKRNLKYSQYILLQICLILEGSEQKLKNTRGIQNLLTKTHETYQPQHKTAMEICSRITASCHSNAGHFLFRVFKFHICMRCLDSTILRDLEFHEYTTDCIPRLKRGLFILCFHRLPKLKKTVLG